MRVKQQRWPRQPRAGGSIAVDERAARRIAAHDLGADRITGTVGILRAAVAQDHITIVEGDELLQLMIDDGYWSPVQSLREVSDG
jgi:predicted nucleic acid-binding protein